MDIKISINVKNSFSTMFIVFCFGKRRGLNANGQQSQIDTGVRVRQSLTYYDCSLATMKRKLHLFKF